jgi:DNA-binding response OmpR family regulator
MKIVWVVEDDSLQRVTICTAIKEKFNAHIIELSTEYEFRQQLENLAEPYPELIVLDVMLPWTKPMEDMPEAPKEVKENRFYRAGMRCEKLVRKKRAVKHIPIIIYTNLAQEDIQDDLNKLSNNTHTVYLGKSSEIKELLDKIKNCSF